MPCALAAASALPQLLPVPLPRVLHAAPHVPLTRQCMLARWAAPQLANVIVYHHTRVLAAFGESRKRFLAERLQAHRALSNAVRAPARSSPLRRLVADPCGCMCSGSSCWRSGEDCRSGSGG